jgi:hypothetical protein
MFLGVLASRASEDQGGRSAQGAKPDGSGRRWGIRPVESIEGPGRCSGRCSGGQAEMLADLGDHGGMPDGGDDLQGATVLEALLDVDLEPSFEQPGPAHRGRRRGRGTSA